MVSRGRPIASRLRDLVHQDLCETCQGTGTRSPTSLAGFVSPGLGLARSRGGRTRPARGVARPCHRLASPALGALSRTPRPSETWIGNRCASPWLHGSSARCCAAIQRLRRATESASVTQLANRRRLRRMRPATHGRNFAARSWAASMRPVRISDTSSGFRKQPSGFRKQPVNAAARQSRAGGLCDTLPVGKWGSPGEAWHALRHVASLLLWAHAWPCGHVH